jgi:hypothetical protein
MSSLIIPPSVRRRSFLDPSRARGPAKAAAPRRRLSGSVAPRKTEMSASVTRVPGVGIARFQTLAKKSLYVHYVHNMGGGGKGSL